jgi:hypothetical protein
MHTHIRLQLGPPEPFADGLHFGEVGPYVRLTSRALFAVDPQAPAYNSIVDLEHAPRNAAGLVEYTTEVCILQPANLARGNRRLLYEVINRGNKRALQFFNDAPHSNTPHSAVHAGNGFLMRRGYTVVWSAWQGDLLPGDGRMTMELPIAVADHSAITGVVRAEFIADTPGVRSYPLSGNDYTRSYPTTTLDTSLATFTYRPQEGDARQPMPSAAWQFARCDAAGKPLPSATDCYLPEGFRPGWIYELIYTAQEPLVLGLGLTSIRDLVSFLRHAAVDAAGTPNPLQGNGVGMVKAYAWGRSQSGRLLRELVYRGFNQDVHGRAVFDGIAPHVTGGGRGALNYRFAQPGRYPRQHEDHLYPSDQFPFAYVTSTDPLSGQTDGILKRPETDPLVLHTQTSSEYWQRRGSLVHTDTLGRDLEEHSRVRIYLFASAQHFAAPRGTAQRGIHQHLSNPLDTAPLLRALLEALDHWATDGTPPPASRLPRRADGTLVSASVVHDRFPRLPGVACPQEPNRLYLLDYGADFSRGQITQEPPRLDTTREYTVLVPLVDADGNEVPGIRTPHVEVPLATFTGWNPRAVGYGAAALASITGSYLPFAHTAAERQASEDPRPALAERYRSPADYVRRMARAAQQLVDERLLLEEDADRYVEGAMQESISNGTHIFFSQRH